jgi:hypothetical protein
MFLPRASLPVVEYDGHAVEGYHIGDTGTETVASKLVYCGFGHGICNGAEDNICLMFRLNVGHTLESLLESCEESKGVGAIIFDPENDDLISTWKVSSDITIPAMAVTMSTVAYLYQNVLGFFSVSSFLPKFCAEKMSNTCFNLANRNARKMPQPIMLCDTSTCGYTGLRFAGL